MTRFARAQGSKSSNKKVAEDSTPWRLLKSGMKCLNGKEGKSTNPTSQEVDVNSSDYNLPSQSSRSGKSSSRSVIDEETSSLKISNNVNILKRQLADQKKLSKVKNKHLKKDKDFEETIKIKRKKATSTDSSSQELKENSSTNSLFSRSISSGKSNPKNNFNKLPLNLFKSKKKSDKRFCFQEFDNKETMLASNDSNLSKWKVTDVSKLSMNKGKDFEETDITIKNELKKTKNKKRDKKIKCYECKSSYHVFENCPQITKDLNIYSSTGLAIEALEKNIRISDKLVTRTHDVLHLTNGKADESTDSTLVNMNFSNNNLPSQNFRSAKLNLRNVTDKPTSLFKLGNDKPLSKTNKHSVKRSHIHGDDHIETPSPKKALNNVNPLEQQSTNQKKFSAKKLKKQLLKEGKFFDEIDVIMKNELEKTSTDSISQEVEGPSDNNLSSHSVHSVELNLWSAIEKEPFSLPKSKKLGARRSCDKKDDEILSPKKCLTFLNPSGWRLTDPDKFALNEMKNKLLNEGKDLEVIDKIMENETRQIIKKHKKNNKQKCFICQAYGHTLKDCPENEKSEICFICGSTEHKFTTCRQKKKTHDKFAFAKCFICKEQGHISTVCPDNPSGLYPFGGGCHKCGEVTHFSRDCPQQQKAKTKNSLTLLTLSDDVEGLPEDKPSEKILKPNKRVKTVKF